MSLSTRLNRLESELRARNAVTCEKIVRRVPYWQDPDEYLKQMIASGEITEAQRGDVSLIQQVIVRPAHKFNEKGEIVEFGSEVVPLEELQERRRKELLPHRRSAANPAQVPSP